MLLNEGRINEWMDKSAGQACDPSSGLADLAAHVLGLIEISEWSCERKSCDIKERCEEGFNGKGRVVI